MKIVIMTLGCKVNKYESDSIKHYLKLKGFEVSDKLGYADVYIINTCAVTAEAEKKSRQMIARCKKFNKSAKFFVCGCASQNNPEQFLSKGALYVSGVAAKVKITDYVEKMKEKVAGNLVSPLPLEYEDDMHAEQDRMRAYIKIQDGCNNFCSYCLIPYLRGRSRSRDIISIIKEVASLPEDIKEVVLTGINVTDYRIDGEPALLTVLEQLDGFGKRLRLSSMEESLVSDEFVAGLKNLKNFCPHFHLSLQSGSESVLKRMNRKYSPNEFLQSVERIRRAFPLAGITTDVIVGFPEETEEEFNETVEFIKKVRFSDLHIFQYSRRSGTVASKRKDLSPDIKQRRFEILNALKGELRLEFIKKNKHCKVLIEEKEDNLYIGYSENYIKCYLESRKDLLGKVVEVKMGHEFKDGARARVKKIL